METLKPPRKAIDILMTRGCGHVIHLGNFCDINRRDRLKDVIRLFQERKVITVKTYERINIFS